MPLSDSIIALLLQHLGIETLRSAIIEGFGITLAAVLSWFIARRGILACLRHMISRTKNRLDDILLEKKVLSRLAHLAPAAVIHEWAPELSSSEQWISSSRMLANLYMLIVGALFINAFIDAIAEAYDRYSKSTIPIRGLLQAVKIIVFFLAGVLMLSTLTDKSPTYFLGSLGAMSMVLMLIFKDSILGLVAGIQLAANRMVRRGDWIEMPQFGADGNVIEVSLNTVKVQNWDMTVTTIPTYALISNSFKNWRGMNESGGRRIKRNIVIDMKSVKFCDTEMLERFKKVQLIHDYLQGKSNEVMEYNRSQKVNSESMVNGRRLTNLGTFRAYVESYLRQHPDIHDKMTFLVRQLAPSRYGLPIEIYVFSKVQAWVEYESIIGDIIDHLLAVIPEFDLRVFQIPTELTVPDEE